MNFHSFASECGLLIRDVVPDGKIYRCPTESHPAKKNGAYMFAGDWGWCQAWDVHPEPQIWQGDKSRTSEIDPSRMRELLARRAEDIRVKQERAAKQAVEILGRSEVSRHAYLDRKGFPEETGFVDGDHRLLIPMRDCQNYRKTLSIQSIAVDGEKRFLLGGRTKGAVFVLGNTNAPTAWLCEGYATGLSVHAAMQMMRLNGRVVVCFSAGNLAHVAGLVAGRRYIVADHDASGTGAEFAQRTGLLWGMPDEVNTDANDLHQTKGIYAVAALLQKVMNQIN